MLTKDELQEYREMVKNQDECPPLSADYWFPPLLRHIDEQAEQIKSLEHIILELKAEIYDIEHCQNQK